MCATKGFLETICFVVFSSGEGLESYVPQVVIIFGLSLIVFFSIFAVQNSFFRFFKIINILLQRH